MEELLKEDLQFIEKICGKDYVTRYLGIQKREKDNNVRVVNTGMVSSGKSSLYNVLIDSIESEQFPTGAARTTKESECFNKNNIYYIDTPGIDVKEEDDTIAFNTIMEADIIMIVHNIKTGPLNRSEAEWLERIVKNLKSVEACKSRLIFICTWKDTRERDEDYKNIINDVKRMVFDIVGDEIPFFDVSVKKYLDSKIKEKPILCEKSGIQELKNYLEEYVYEYLDKKKKFDKAEKEELLSEIYADFINYGNANVEKANLILMDAEQKYEKKKNTWTRVYDVFEYKRKQLDKKKEELASI